MTIGFTNGIENQGAMDFEYGSGNVLKHLSPLEYARGMLKQDILRFFGIYKSENKAGESVKINYWEEREENTFKQGPKPQISVIETVGHSSSKERRKIVP